jgi:hypothetical protein
VKRLLAALMGMAVGLVVCEGAVRLGADRLLDLRHPTVGFDPELGWVQRPGATAVRHNEAGEEIVVKGSPLGIREPDQPYVVEGRDVVLVVGDSMTAGTQVRFADTWGAQLQERLRRRHPRLTAVNAGVDRYGLVQEYRLARRLWRGLRPRHLVAALYLGNDLIDYEADLSARPPWTAGGPLSWIADRSYLYHFAAGALSGKRRRTPSATGERREPSPVDGWTPRGVAGFDALSADQQARIRGQFAAGDVLPVLRGGEEAERRLASAARAVQAMAELARGREAGFTLVVLPLKQEVIPGWRAEWMALQGLRDQDLERPRRYLMEAAARGGYRAVDVTEALRGHPRPEELYWPVDSHMTVRGHAFLAEILAPEIDRGLAKGAESSRGHVAVAPVI